MKKGFTLIELIVVIAIIAILAAIIAPNAFKAIEKAKVSASVGDYKSLKTGAMSFYADTGTWPDQEDDGTGFVNNDNNVTGWDGPYLEKWPNKASWGGDYAWCVVTDSDDGDCVAWDNDANEERYVLISDVPQAAAVKIDENLDGEEDNDDGSVRYGTSATTDVQILVSED
ncbi:MAG: type II secretion system protein GspG [Candidatus Omnitrophica bacterium]|nr:type II secretion system protein GspG [Candidatus Omnitrophota bacterium]MCF7894112.1 type II secretion system protein GspG [Candidatus Omnitrophota bacterium]